ncbi:phage portal protein [Candidatus Proelusimicrobium excrementi]|uniref:phage portal protein n=1 Tax=Candidatus Proelusimicrobium excrementi TaxID=3416222 RepID=UPI003C912DBE|nr:phage portal protein [Elusimicrobiaceae bacterium]MBR3927727.1 phage portal protein [Clostridia bacterium]
MIPILKPDEIKKWIDNDKASEKKRLAQKGVDYYEGRHDIQNSKIFYVDGNGEIKEDTTKSNIKIPHPFFTENVDQTVQYVLSGEEGIFKSDDPELQKILDERFNENDDFNAQLYEVVQGGQVKGFEYMYAYKDKDMHTAFECADSMGVVEVRAKDTADKCDYLIYWYIDRVGVDNEKIIRIQVWDQSQTYFYVQTENGKIELDKEQEINPRPHTVYKKDGDKKTYYEDFGEIPFFKLSNGRKEVSALWPIKPLIDDYDIMNCGLSNNIQDTVEALYFVTGFQGQNLDELIFNIKAKKAVGAPDGGSIQQFTTNVPVEARKLKMEVDEQNIYRFGFGLNTHGLKDTAATTNIAIKSAYSLLDLKANKIIISLKQFLRKLLKIVLKEINDEHGKDYRQSDVYFRFDPEIPTNALENAQIALTEAQVRQTEINTVLALQDTLDNETMVQLICEQLDISYEDIKDKLPNPEGVTDLYPTETDPEDGGLVE